MNHHTDTDDMPITETSLIAIIFKNLLWLLALAFYPVLDWVIVQVQEPSWKVAFENFKLIGGAIIVVLVIFKLLLEIKKLKKK